MSGICGIIDLDGAPVNREVLQALTASILFRGPDAQNTWVDGPVGFGHTLFCTTLESEGEHQPCSLDGRVWITADARIDGRDELNAKLAAHNRLDLEKATDAELILHAYHAWGTDCLKHLIGDFAFAIWDGVRQKLFCARDHFGIKPFFYAQVGRYLIFSNTLNCIRQHPAVSNTLNDLAIADFLLFEENKDPATTAFADIQRLMPAHAFTWSPRSQLQISRYWSLPTDLGVRYRPAGDYVEHFKYLLGLAVADRLRTNRVGVEMSGGLDSSSIAATALGILSRQSQPFEINAQTIVFDHLIPDKERYYASLVAQQLNIPIHFIVGDNYQLFERWDQPETSFPEPLHAPLAAQTADMVRSAAKLGRVFLAGWDGDALLSESLRPYFKSLARSRRYVRLAVELLRYAISQRQLVPPDLLQWLRGNPPQVSPDAAADEGYPDWLNPDLEERFNLRARWRQHRGWPRTDHPTRPYAYTIYSVPNLGLFDHYDAGALGVPIEYRHPLMDLRLLDYCLSLPLQPWVVKKHILREAMRDVLPEQVRTRPKSPLAGQPWHELLKKTAAGNFDSIPWVKDLARFVKPHTITKSHAFSETPEKCWRDMRPLSLGLWLRRETEFLTKSGKAK